MQAISKMSLHYDFLFECIVIRTVRVNLVVLRYSLGWSVPLLYKQGPMLYLQKEFLPVRRNFEKNSHLPALK